MTPSQVISQREHFECVKSEYCDSSIKQALATGRINHQDEALIREFIAERRGSMGISIGRANKIAYTLIGWRHFLPPFADLTMADIYAGIEALRSGTNQWGRPFKQNTQHDYIRILKQFLLWMIENEYTSIPEKKVKKIRTPSQDMMTKKASDLLTPQEVQDMVKACHNSRNRALIFTLYEGGFRIGEIGQLRWDDFKIDSKGIAINLDFKTGMPRYIRLIMSKPYLAEWRSNYPGPITPDSFVFVGNDRKPLSYAAVSKMIKRTAKEAGITKRITPHLFRHSRITHLLQEGMRESSLKMMMWGTIGTEMLRTYAHLTGSDIDSEISRLYGLDSEKSKSRHQLKPIICPNCYQVNPPGEDYCRECMEPLTPEAIAEEENLRQFIKKNFTSLMKYFDKVGREQTDHFQPPH